MKYWELFQAAAILMQDATDADRKTPGNDDCWRLFITNAANEANWHVYHNPTSSNPTHRRQRRRPPFPAPPYFHRGAIISYRI